MKSAKNVRHDSRSDIICPMLCGNGETSRTRTLTLRQLELSTSQDRADYRRVSPADCPERSVVRQSMRWSEEPKLYSARFRPNPVFARGFAATVRLLGAPGIELWSKDQRSHRRNSLRRNASERIRTANPWFRRFPLPSSGKHVTHPKAACATEFMSMQQRPSACRRFPDFTAISKDYQRFCTGFRTERGTIVVRVQNSSEDGE